MPTNRPNILLFMNDQQQALPTMPGHPCRTPHADRLAAEAILFGRCYTTAAHCCPSRASAMTGLYPSGHGVFNNVLTNTAIHEDLRPGVHLWSEGLREAGYQLKWSGKWHVSRNLEPGDFGWEGLLVGASGRDRHERSWEQWHEAAAQGQDRPGERGRGELLRPGWGACRHYGTLPKAPGQAHDFTPVDHWIATTGIEGLLQAAAGREPWCVYIGPNGPHDPYIIPEKYATMYDPRTIPMPASWQDDLRDRPVIYQRQRRFWQQLSPDEQREALAHYWGYCTMQDDLLGLVLQALETTGQAANTLVIFTSDHGDYGGAHGLWMKGVPAFDEAYHIPLIMRWPAGIAAPGREVGEFVSVVDFSPTFLELAGAPALEPCHGRSLVPFMRGERPDDWRDTLCTQFNGVELYYSQRAVLTRDWKYVFNGFDWDELYDLQADPHEMHNLAPRPEDPHPESDEVIRELCARLWRFSEATDDFNHNPYATVSLCPYGPMTGLDR